MWSLDLLLTNSFHVSCERVSVLFIYLNNERVPEICMQGVGLAFPFLHLFFLCGGWLVAMFHVWYLLRSKTCETGDRQDEHSWNCDI